MADGTHQDTSIVDISKVTDELNLILVMNNKQYRKPGVELTMVVLV